VAEDEQDGGSKKSPDVMSQAIAAKKDAVRRIKARAGSAAKPLPPLPLRSLRGTQGELMGWERRELLVTGAMSWRNGNLDQEDVQMWLDLTARIKAIVEEEQYEAIGADWME
jgi:hypothetical protein